MSRDFLYKEQLHPLGTSLLQESYTSSLTPLAEEYGLAEKLRFKERGIWKTNFANDTNSKLSDKEAIEEAWQNITGSSNTTANVIIFLEVILKSGAYLACRQLVVISGCTSRCLAHTKAT